ncbi:hypothetical protein BH10BAC3_BH10BAC3_04410 [soil metagenome]
MKKVILGLAALAMVTCTFAQPNGGHHKGQRPGMEQGQHRMDFKKLNLSDAQQQQMKTLNGDFHKQMQELNSKQKITVKEQRDQRAELVKTHKAKIDGIFTAEQKQQLAQMKADNAKKREEMAAQRLAKMKEHLSLTDAQVASIKSSQQSTHSKIEAILKDDNIAREDKKQQLMALRQEMKTNIDKVLTSDQKVKMEAERKERQEKMKSFKGRRMHNDDVK